MNDNMVKLNKEEIMITYSLYEKLYQNYLKKALSIYDETQLYRVKRGLYYIDKNIIDKVFSRRRRPNKDNNLMIRDYVLTQNFDYISVIRPQSATEKECVDISKIIHKELVKNTNCEYLTTYWFIEKNNKQKNEFSSQYHIHMLLQTDVKTNFTYIGKRAIKDLMGGAPFLQKYNNEKWSYSGKKYSVKQVSEYSMVGYETYRKRKKY